MIQKFYDKIGQFFTQSAKLDLSIKDIIDPDMKVCVVRTSRNGLSYIHTDNSVRVTVEYKGATFELMGQCEPENEELVEVEPETLAKSDLDFISDGKIGEIFKLSTGTYIKADNDKAFLCDGSERAVSESPELASLIMHKYGIASNQYNFVLPNLSGSDGAVSLSRFIWP